MSSSEEYFPSGSDESAVQPEHDIVLSNASSTPGDKPSGIDVIETTMGVLREADRASLSALQSKNFLVGHVTLHSVDSSLDALDTLVLTANKLKNELCQRCAQIIVNKHSIHNVALPIMRLLPDILPLIIDFVACVWRPGKQNYQDVDLGWFKTAHVCAAWRRTVTSLAMLWARELGAFYSPESFWTTLSRARGAPLTLLNTLGFSDQCDTPKHYWYVLSQPYRIETVSLDLNPEAIARLAYILYHRSNNVIKKLSIRTMGKPSEEPEPHPTVPSFPNLRWLSFGQLYIPFQAENLIAFSIHAHDVLGLSASCTNFLDALESCQKLTFLQLSCWTSAFDLHFPHRKVRLPYLQTFIAARPDTDTDAQYIGLIQQLDLPALRYLVLDDCLRFALIVISSVFDWLLSNKPMPPCLDGVSELSINASGRTSRFHAKSARICFDDGSLESTEARSSYMLTLPETTMETRRGVHFRLKYLDFEEDAILNSALFDSVVASCLNFGGCSAAVPVVRSAYFNFRNINVDWHAVLRHLADAEILRASYRESSTLLPVLSKASPDTTILLPHLKAIVWHDVDDLAWILRAENKADERTEAADRIHEMFSARAAHGVPLARMEAICDDAKQKDGEDAMHRRANKEAVDAFFAEIVSLWNAFPTM